MTVYSQALVNDASHFMGNVTLAGLTNQIPDHITETPIPLSDIPMCVTKGLKVGFFELL